MDAHDTFYFVWNPSRSAPTVKHPSEEIAMSEAKRLARLNPGEKFFVLQAIAALEKIDVGVVKLGSGGANCCCDCHIPF